MRLEEQKQPCPNCGELAGWWSGIQRNKSMVFHAANGEVTERRIEESKEKHCAKCDATVTKCVGA